MNPLNQAEATVKQMKVKLFRLNKEHLKVTYVMFEQSWN